MFLIFCYFFFFFFLIPFAVDSYADITQSSTDETNTAAAGARWSWIIPLSRFSLVRSVHKPQRAAANHIVIHLDIVQNNNNMRCNEACTCNSNARACVCARRRSRLRSDDCWYLLCTREYAVKYVLNIYKHILWTGIASVCARRWPPVIVRRVTSCP